MALTRGARPAGRGAHARFGACLLGVLAAVTACERAAPAAPDALGAPDGPPADGAGAGEALVVVTINLRCLIDDWEARLPLLVDGLVAAGADLIGVQEVCAEPGGRDALEQLAAALAARGGGALAQTRTITHRAWDAYDEGLAILSRHPIAAVDIVPLTGGAIPRKLIAARVLAPDGPRVFAVTHLDHQSGDARALQAATVAGAIAELAAGAPTILVGDLNEAPGGGVSTALAGAGLTDAWAALHPSDDGFTFPAAGPQVRIRLRVDRRRRGPARDDREDLDHADRRDLCVRPRRAARDAGATISATMKSKLFGVLIPSLLAVTACGGGRANPEAPAPVPATDCTEAAAHVAAQTIAEVERLAVESPDAYPTPAPEAAATHRDALAADLDGACRSAGWTVEATACLRQSTADTLEGCYVHLPEASRTAVGAQIKQHVEALLAAKPAP